VKRLKDWLFFLAMAPAWLEIVRADELDEAAAICVSTFRLPHRCKATAK
jgi:hypothetical protein